MKMISKENVNPLSPAEQYGLRKSIPFRLSSILKNSNKPEHKKTLAEVSVQYEIDKQKLKNAKPKTPLIKQNQQRSKSNILFFKNPKRTVTQIPINPHKNFLLSTKDHVQSNVQEQTDSNNQEERLNGKLMQLINMINTEDKNKLHRCYSSVAIDIKPSYSPLIKFRNKKNSQIPLPQPIGFTEISNQLQSPQIRVKNPSFLFKTTSLIRASQPIQSHSRPQLTKSSYFQSQSSLKINQQRMSHYQPLKKLQTSQYRLCINCESYVNQNLVTEHEQKCLGFKIILKMTNDKLIDFLNDKIQAKLNQLKQIQSKMKEAKHKNSDVNCIEMLNFIQSRNKVDQVLTDLDAIRLKALKRFHTKHRQTQQSKS